MTRPRKMRCLRGEMGRKIPQAGEQEAVRDLQGPPGKTRKHREGTPTERGAAAMMELHYQGIYPKPMKRMLQLIDAEPPKRWNIGKWTEHCTAIAAQEDPDAAIDGSSLWAIITNDINNSGKSYTQFAIIDQERQYILATQVSETPALTEKTIQDALSKTSASPTQITTNIIDRGLEELVRRTGNSQVQVKHANLGKIIQNPRIKEFCEISRSRNTDTRGRRSLQNLQTYTSGLALDLNNFRALGPDDLRTPAQAAGLQTKYQDWDQIAREMLAKRTPAPGQRPPRPRPEPEEPDPRPRDEKATTLLEQVEEFLQNAQARQKALSLELRQLNDEVEAATIMASVLRQRETGMEMPPPDQEENTG